MKYNNGYLYVQTDNGTVRVKADPVSEERANVEWSATIDRAADIRMNPSISELRDFQFVNIAPTTTLKDAFARHAIECSTWEQMEHLAKLAEGCGYIRHYHFNAGDLRLNDGDIYFSVSKESDTYCNYEVVIDKSAIITYPTFISTYCPSIGIASHTVTPNEQDWQVRWRKIGQGADYEDVWCKPKRGNRMNYFGSVSGYSLLESGFTHYIPQSLLLNLPTE